MQVRVKTPRIRVDIEGEAIPNELMAAVRRVFTEDEIEIVDGDDGFVDWFDTDLHREIDARMTPGDVMRIYRENHGWTQERLGAEIGSFTRQHVSDMENGRRVISAETAIKLSRIFDISVERILRVKDRSDR